MHALASYLVVTAPLFWFGLARNFFLVHWGLSAHLAAVATWWLITVGWILRAARKTPLPTRWDRTAVFLSVLLIPAFDLLNVVQFSSLGYRTPGWALAICAAGAVLIYRNRNAPASRKIALAGLFSALHGAALIIDFPLNPQRSDMFPLIQGAAKFFLQGLPPWSFRFSSHYSIPYAPGTWLPYVITDTLNLDPRWMNFVFRLGWTSLLALEARKNNRLNSSVTTWIQLIILSPYLAYRHDLYLDGLYLLLVGATLLAVHSRQKTLILVGSLACFTSQWAWLFAPFWVLICVPPMQFIKQITRLALGLTGLTALFFGIFIARDGWGTWQALFQHLSAIDSQLIVSELCPGLSGPIFALREWTPNFDPRTLLNFTQRLALIAGGLWALRLKFTGASTESLLQTGFWTVFMAIAAGPQIENYYYTAPFIFLASGWVANTTAVTPTGQRQP